MYTKIFQGLFIFGEINGLFFPKNIPQNISLCEQYVSTKIRWFTVFNGWIQTLFLRNLKSFNFETEIELSDFPSKMTRKIKIKEVT